MKSTRSIARIAAILLSLFVLIAASFAATNPLNGPFGLALDAKGNLWVANLDSNNILEFNPNYELQPTATITTGLNFPIGLAFDHAGNLWVANALASNGGAYGSVSMYTNGVQNPAATITNGIVSPWAMAIDGLGNLWVSNDATNITVYAMSSPNTFPTTLINTLSFPSFPVHGLTVSSTAYAFGSGANGTIVCPPQWDLVRSLISGFALGGNNSGSALATAANGHIYIGNFDGTVNVFDPATQTVSPFVQLSFVPSGIAVDNLRGRVYIANGDYGTSIAVYSTSGTLLHTIQ